MPYASNFAEFEVKELCFQFKSDGQTTAYTTKCIGTSEQEDELSVVTKPCGKSVINKRVSPTGNGTIDLAAHFPENLINAIYNMSRDGLIPGVKAMGNTVILPEFTLLQRITDDTGKEKIRIFPRVCAENGLTHSLDNSATEVGYGELSLSYMPDEKGEGYYDALVDELGDSANTLVAGWFEGFDLTTLYTAATAQSEAVEA